MFYSYSQRHRSARRRRVPRQRGRVRCHERSVRVGDLPRGSPSFPRVEGRGVRRCDGGRRVLREGSGGRVSILVSVSRRGRKEGRRRRTRTDGAARGSREADAVGADGGVGEGRATRRGVRGGDRGDVGADRGRAGATDERVEGGLSQGRR